VLVDIPMVGRRYTWYNVNGIAKSRIDRNTCITPMVGNVAKL